MCDVETTCHRCGDKLIHQLNRGPHESSSAFGQFVHDMGETLRGEWLQMFWADVDGAVFKRATKILRIIEHKPNGKSASKSQEDILPLLAKAIQLLASTGLIDERSGVFIVNADPPYDKLHVTPVRGWPRGKNWQPFDIAADQRDDFLKGKPLDRGLPT